MTESITPHPVEGYGIRAMGCRMYDACLYQAAIKDWCSFNCEDCAYDDKYALEFIDPAVIPDLIEPEAITEADLETELIDFVYDIMPVYPQEEPYHDHIA